MFSKIKSLNQGGAMPVIQEEKKAEQETKEPEINKNDLLFVWAMRVHKKPEFRSLSVPENYRNGRDEVRTLMDLNKFIRWFIRNQEVAEKMRKDHLDKRTLVQFQIPVLA